MYTKTALEELYSDDQYCYREVCIAYDLIHSSELTDEFVERIGKTFGIMYCHCSKDVQDRIQSLMYDLRLRKYIIDHKDEILKHPKKSLPHYILK